jgi:hypothetical protein
VGAEKVISASSESGFVLGMDESRWGSAKKSVRLKFFTRSKNGRQEPFQPVTVEKEEKCRKKKKGNLENRKTRKGSRIYPAGVS